MYLTILTSDLGIRIQLTFSLVCVVNGDYSRDINCLIPPAYCMLGRLACYEAYQFGQLGLVVLFWVIFYSKAVELFYY